MAPTRRVPAQSDEKVSPNEPNTDESSPLEGSSTTPEIPTPVLINFLVFTLAMLVLPLGSYFLSLNSLFGGNTVWSAATAALVANLVLAAFVVQALREDRSDKRAAKAEGKKER
ncbi:hypothetical protein VUR80DRAFT_7354 [Thermomyces stellatus]